MLWTVQQPLMRRGASTKRIVGMVTACLMCLILVVSLGLFLPSSRANVQEGSTKTQSVNTLLLESLGLHASPAASTAQTAPKVAATKTTQVPGGSQSRGTAEAGMPTPRGTAGHHMARHQRVVVIADLHGDLHQAHTVLQLLDVTDKNGHWTAGNALLVQLGDIVDRGDHSLDLLDYFERLQEEARSAGGLVVMLLGNHELMLIQQDFRYVNRDELARLGDGSVKAGLARYKEALAPTARYGRMLRSRSLVYISDVPGCQMLLVHAALLPWMLDVAGKRLEAASAQSTTHGGSPSEATPAAAQRYVEEWNKLLQAHLSECASRECREASQHPDYQLAERLLGGEGPLWSRQYVLSEPQQVCNEVENLTKQLGVTRIVVGHTVQNSGRVGTLCAGRLMMIDLGMSREILGNVGGLQCRAGAEAADIVVRYPDQDIAVPSL